MKSLQLETIGTLKLKQTAVPETITDEILLKVTHCALCRTDAKMWERGHRDLVLPRVLGHEICGVSESGKRFVVWPGRACGYCRQCRNKTENLCKRMKITGFHKDGGLAEYVAVSESSLIPVPDDLPGDIACFAEPLGCAINAVEQAQVSEKHRVLVYGAGPVGLLVSLAVHVQGACAFIKEINIDRLMQSENFRNMVGFECAMEHRKGEFDAAINAAPAADTFTDGISELAAGGCFCLFSGLIDSTPFPISIINEIHYRQLRITGAYGCTRAQMEEAVTILSNYKDEVRLLIEEYIGLGDVPFILPKILMGGVFKFIVEF